MLKQAFSIRCSCKAEGLVRNQEKHLMNQIFLRVLAAALLAVVCNTANAGLEWSLSTNPVNGNNTASNDLEVIFSVTASGPTLEAIRTGNFGTSQDAQCVDTNTCDGLGGYAVNFSIDSFGQASGNTFDLQVTNLIAGLTPLSPTTYLSQPTPSNYFFLAGPIFMTPVPSLMALFDSTATVDVLKLEIDIDDFIDNVNVSDVDVSILPGVEFESGTQFGEFGSADAPERTNEIFYAYPTANSSAPNSGESITQRYSAVPEPSSFAYLGLFTLSVTGISWYRRRTQVTA